MKHKLKKILLVSRPISWPNTAYPFGAGYLLSGGMFDMTFVLGTLYFLIPYNLLMYGINDIFDYESDIRNPRKGGLEGAKEQKALHPLIWKAVIATNLPFVIWFILSGSLVSKLIFAIVIFFVVAYSIKYLRFKEIPLLDSVTSSAHFVGPLIFALTLTEFSAQYVPFVAAFFLWGMASHAFGAVQDIIPDRQGKIASIATLLGARTTVWFAIILYGTSSLILVTQGWLATIVGVTGLTYLLNILPYATIQDEQSAIANSGWKRFIWLNFFTGFIITLVLLISVLPKSVPLPY